MFDNTRLNTSIGRRKHELDVLRGLLLCAAFAVFPQSAMGQGEAGTSQPPQASDTPRQPDANQDQPDANQGQPNVNQNPPNAEDDTEKLKRRIQELEATRDADANAEAQSQRLMSAGFTIGYALAIATGTPWKTEARMINAQSTQMPYLLVLPAYWGKPKALRDYCAAAWIGGDEYEATRAAMIVARRAANELVLAVKASIRAGLPSEQTYYELLDVTGSLTNATVIYGLVKKGVEAKDTIDAQAYEDRAIGQLSQWIWNPSLKASCGWRQLGLWLGKPADFEGGIRIDGTRSQSTITSVVGLGLGYSPNSYFTILAGWTFTHLPDADGARNSSTLVFGVGGNIDALGALAR